MSRVLHILVLLSATVTFGTLGFTLIEGWDWFDALYQSVTTITTVGFQEIHPMDRPGRTFVMIYLVFGLGVFTYCLFQVGELAYRAKLRDWMARRQMDTTIDSLSGHFIVCGFGRMGRAICLRLLERNMPFVVIDESDDALAECRARGWPWLLGDATDDATLLKGGIARARGMAAVLSNDADNVYLVLSARLLARELQIIARAMDEQSGPKLMKAGATRVVGLHDTGAAKIAQLMINPNLDQFMEIFQSRGLELDLAEIEVSSSAPYAGRRLDETDFSRQGVTVVAVRRADGQLLLPPAGATELAIKDRLILIGRSEAIAGLLQGA